MDYGLHIWNDIIPNGLEVLNDLILVVCQWLKDSTAIRSPKNLHSNKNIPLQSRCYNYIATAITRAGVLISYYQ